MLDDHFEKLDLLSKQFSGLYQFRNASRKNIPIRIRRRNSLVLIGQGNIIVDVCRFRMIKMYNCGFRLIRTINQNIRLRLLKLLDKMYVCVVFDVNEINLIIKITIVCNLILKLHRIIFLCDSSWRSYIKICSWKYNHFSPFFFSILVFVLRMAVKRYLFIITMYNFSVHLHIAKTKNI